MSTVLNPIRSTGGNEAIFPRGVVVLGETTSLRAQATCDGMTIVSQPSGAREADVSGVELTPWVAGLYVIQLTLSSSPVRTVEIVAVPSTVNTHPILGNRGVVQAIASDPRFTSADALAATWVRPWPTLGGSGVSLAQFGAPSRSDMQPGELIAWRATAAAAEAAFVALRDA
jgi:hypothetical protein